MPAHKRPAAQQQPMMFKKQHSGGISDFFARGDLQLSVESPGILVGSQQILTESPQSPAASQELAAETEPPLRKRLKNGGGTSPRGRRTEDSWAKFWALGLRSKDTTPICVGSGQRLRI